MPSPSRIPVLVLSLIGAILLLTVSAIALIVMFNANRPDSVAIAAACKAEVGAAIKTETDKVAKACAEKPVEPTFIKVDPNARHPGFSYPTGWSVVGQILENRNGSVNTEYYSMMMTPGYIDQQCTGCDPYIAPITIDSRARSLYPQLNVVTLKDLATKYYAPFYLDNPTMTEETINGAQVIVVRAQPPDEHSRGGILENILYATDKTVVLVSLNSTVEGWKTVRSSLDFSKIE